MEQNRSNQQQYKQKPYHQTLFESERPHFNLEDILRSARRLEFTRIFVVFLYFLILKDIRRYNFANLYDSFAFKPSKKRDNFQTKNDVLVFDTETVVVRVSPPESAKTPIFKAFIPNEQFELMLLQAATAYADSDIGQINDPSIEQLQYLYKQFINNKSAKKILYKAAS